MRKGTFGLNFMNQCAIIKCANSVIQMKPGDFSAPASESGVCVFCFGFITFPSFMNCVRLFLISVQFIFSDIIEA